MSPLNIHFFVQFVHEQGTYFRFHNLAIGLTKLGHIVTVFGCDQNPNSQLREEVRDGVIYHITPTSKGASLFGGFCHPISAFRRSLHNYPSCDVAHLFQPFPNAALSWMWKLSRKAKVRFYDWDDLWVGGLWREKPNSFQTWWNCTTTNYLEQRLPQQAGHVTTCSHFLENLALKRGARETTVLHNGFWSFEVPNKLAARERLGLLKDALYVGFMGRTCNELPWCFGAIEKYLSEYPQLRFALCGAPDSALKDLPEAVQERLDCLGSIPPLATRDFAAAIDLGLLPLEDTPFNQSRFPIKYAEYMAAGTPVLCSEVGECAQISEEFPWVLKAGKTQSKWEVEFGMALKALVSNQVTPVDILKVGQFFAWEILSSKLQNIYFLSLEEKNLKF